MERALTAVSGFSGGGSRAGPRCRLSPRGEPPGAGKAGGGARPEAVRGGGGGSAWPGNLSPAQPVREAGLRGA